MHPVPVQPRWEGTRVKSSLETAVGLLLNPDVPDLRDRAYQGLVLVALVRSQSNLSTTALTKSIQDLFQLQKVPALHVDAACDSLKRNGSIIRTGTGWALVPHARSDVQAKLAESNAARGLCVKEFLDRLTADGQTLGADQLKIAETSFYLVLDALAEKLSTEISSFLNGVACDVPVEKLNSVIDGVLGERAQYADPKFREKFVRAVRSILNQPTAQFARAFFSVVNAGMTLKLLQVDPEFHRLRREAFRDTAVLLDTNVLIAAVCEGSDKHKQAIKLLEANRELGVITYVTDRTKAELRDTLDNASRQYKRMRETGLDVSLLQHEVVRTFSRRRLRDWDAFVMDLAQEFRLMQEKFNVREFPRSFRPDPHDLADTMKIVRNFSDTEHDRKRDELAEHDAYNILLIHSERRAKPDAGFHSPWFLTYDRTLRPADAAIRRRLRRVADHAVMPCDAWFDITYQFLAPTMDVDTAADVFTRMVGTDVLPLVSAVTIGDFYEYLRLETGLPDGDLRAIARFVEARQLEPALERAIAKKEGSKALEILASAFDEGSVVQLQTETEDLRARMSAMAKKLKALEEARQGGRHIQVNGPATFVEQSGSGSANTVGNITTATLITERDFVIALEAAARANPTESAFLMKYIESLQSAKDKREKAGVARSLLEFLGRNKDAIQGAGLLVLAANALLGSLTG